jgi:hypothetical protein
MSNQKHDAEPQQLGTTSPTPISRVSINIPKPSIKPIFRWKIASSAISNEERKNQAQPSPPRASSTLSFSNIPKQAEAEPPTFQAEKLRTPTSSLESNGHEKSNNVAEPQPEIGIAQFKSLFFKHTAECGKRLEEMNFGLIEFGEQLKEITTKLFLIDNEINFMQSEELDVKFDELKAKYLKLIPQE